LTEKTERAQTVNFNERSDGAYFNAFLRRRFRRSAFA